MSSYIKCEPRSSCLQSNHNAIMARSIKRKCSVLNFLSNVIALLQSCVNVQNFNNPRMCLLKSLSVLTFTQEGNNLGRGWFYSTNSHASMCYLISFSTYSFPIIFCMHLQIFQLRFSHFDGMRVFIPWIWNDANHWGQAFAVWDTTKKLIQQP